MSEAGKHRAADGRFIAGRLPAAGCNASDNRESRRTQNTASSNNSAEASSR